jgi:beta-lactamase class D
MKSTYYIIGILIFMSCAQQTGYKPISENKISISEVLRPDFQHIIDSGKVKGSILVYDPQAKTSYSNDFSRCDKGFLPASTFKIVNSIIALETGVVENDSTLFRWNGEKRRLPVWEQDMIFRDAFQLSCVPCYQEVARKIGDKRMNEYLKKLNYGNMVVDSANIDVFWLEGESRISMNQQLDFLVRFYNQELPISERTSGIIKKMMLLDSNSSYQFCGKTGWAVRNGNNNGWFVGYLETKNKVYFIVTNIEPEEEFNMDLFPKIRAQISLEAFRKLKIID